MARIHAQPKTVNHEPYHQESPTFPDHGMRSGSFEWKLLLAATAAEPEESKLSRLDSLLKAQRGSKVDWQRLLCCADFHGTSSLLHQNLARYSDVVPRYVLEALKERYVTNVQKSLFLARELTRILDCAQTLNIDLISYKGIVLSEVYYGDMAIRQAGDIDLFVRKRDVVRAKNALRELGYLPELRIPENAEADYLASGYEYSFDGGAGKHLLELQWALQPHYYAVDYDMDGLFGCAVEVHAAGLGLKIPSPEDLLIVLCIHAAKHAWGRIIWLCDVGQVLKRSKLNFDSILSRARELGITRILHLTLLLANRFIGMPLPGEIERAISADGAAHALYEELAPLIAAGVAWEDHKMSYFRLMMRLRERGRDQIRFLSRLTLTPGPGEWQTVNLPRALFPLYKVVRMARLAGRFSVYTSRHGSCRRAPPSPMGGGLN